MKSKLKRACASVAAAAVATSIVPLLWAPAASAAGALQGAASVRTPGGGAAMSSGTSAQSFTLRLPSGAACGGDSANDGYRVQSYMVPASIDPSTLQFTASGPTIPSNPSAFQQPLYTTGFSPYVDAQTANASPSPGPGPIINIPDFTHAVWAPGDIAPGAYNIGIACTQGPAGPTQMKEFWNVTKTFAANGGDGAANVSWSVGAVAAAPTLSSVTPGEGTLTAAFTPGVSDPAATSFTASATDGVSTFTATGAASPLTISGLTNGTSYTVTVTATNSVGTSGPSNSMTGTPAIAPRPAVTNLAAAPGTGLVDLSWTAPTGPAPTGYDVAVSPAAGTTTVSGTTAQVTGLTAGTVYTFTVTPLHPAPYVGTSASVSATPLASQVLMQEITVTRPVGALVFTQVCGVHGDIPADTLGTPGFPSGSLPAIPATTGGTAPTLTAGGADADPKFSEYPYPENPDGTAAPNYPTHCGVALGDAKLVKSGPGAGQFFAAKGVLNQVTIVETRDTDPGWTANGTVSSFVAGPGKSFHGSQLGWTPVKTSDSPAFDDADPATPAYDQIVTAGGVVNPNTVGGLGDGETLGSSLAGQSLGIAQLDARVKLLIPVTAKSGNYTATLTISAI